MELQRVSQRCLSGTQKIVSNEFVKLARSFPLRGWVIGWVNKITFGFVKILETKMLPHSQDSKTSSSTQSGIIKIGSNSRSFEHPSVQTVQLKVCETLVPTFCLQQFQFKTFKSVRSSKSDIYSDRLARRRGLTNILTKQFLPHKIKIRAQRKPRNQRNNTRALRKLHQGYKNSGICKQNPNVLQPCACCAKNKNVKTFRHHKKEWPQFENAHRTNRFS